MTIYIEVFLAQNIIINFCLLRLVYLTTKTQTKFFRLLISSIIGAGFSVFSAIILNSQLAINILKLLCAILMMLIAFKSSVKQFVFNIILFLIYTYAIFGAIISLNSTHYQTSIGLFISSKFNLEIVCSCVVLLTYLFEFVCKLIKKKLKLGKFIYPITLLNGNRRVKINAYLDTGNLLSYNANPVIIIDLKTYLQLFNINLIDFYTHKLTSLSTGTVVGTNCLKICKIDAVLITVNKKTVKFESQYIAINESNAFKNANYHAILSPEMV